MNDKKTPDTELANLCSVNLRYYCFLLDRKLQEYTMPFTEEYKNELRDEINELDGKIKKYCEIVRCL